LLKTTIEGSYSITRRRDAERIMIVLSNIFKDTSKLTITDATACIGGDTLNFALKFGHVHSIELSEENFEALENNVQAYNLHNVTLYQGDCTKLFNWNTNVLYIDPPWGGKDYKKHKELDLFVGKTPGLLARRSPVKKKQAGLHCSETSFQLQFQAPQLFVEHRVHSTVSNPKLFYYSYYRAQTYKIKSSKSFKYISFFPQRS
jgi:hypothetical protein